MSKLVVIFCFCGYVYRDVSLDIVKIRICGSSEEVIRV